MAVICLLASLFAFSSVSVEAEKLVETSAEKVVEVEECEMFSPRRVRIREKASQCFVGIQLAAARRISPTSRFFHPHIERDGINGIGSYLRI